MRIGRNGVQEVRGLRPARRAEREIVIGAERDALGGRGGEVGREQRIGPVAALAGLEIDEAHMLAGKLRPADPTLVVRDVDAAHGIAADIRVGQLEEALLIEQRRSRHRGDQGRDDAQKPAS